jgi:hypothetical protein
MASTLVLPRSAGLVFPRLRLVSRELASVIAVGIACGAIAAAAFTVSFSVLPSPHAAAQVLRHCFSA